MKNKLVLTESYSNPSTRIIYQNMTSGTLLERKEAGNIIAFQNNKTDKPVQEGISLANAVVVRWGNIISLPTNAGTIMYNKAESVKLAMNKRNSRVVFADAGISTPLLLDDNIFTDKHLPVIARPLIHSKGKDIIVLKTTKEFYYHYKDHNQSHYYSQFINKEREFRITCGHGKVLVVHEKDKPEDEFGVNNVNNFKYIEWDETDKQGLYPVMVEALKAVKALGLDMGGVDVMLKDGKAYVLEVNTSPAIDASGYLAKRWAAYFDWLFRQDQRREHWDFTQFKKAKSLIWKNFQLNDTEDK